MCAGQRRASTAGSEQRRMGISVLQNLPLRIQNPAAPANARIRPTPPASVRRIASGRRKPSACREVTERQLWSARGPLRQPRQIGTVHYVYALPVARAIKDGAEGVRIKPPAQQIR